MPKAASRIFSTLSDLIGAPTNDIIICLEPLIAKQTVPNDVLRPIAIYRTWSQNYLILLNLAHNPRTPIGNVVTILTRLQLRDKLPKTPAASAFP